MGLSQLSQVTAAHLRLGTYRFHLWVLNVQMSCIDVTMAHDRVPG